MNFKEECVFTDRTNADIVSFGSGSQPLVLIPGLSLRDVKGVGMGIAFMYRCFAEDFRVYCIDKPNLLRQGVTIAELAEDYADIMQKLGIRNACIMGISMGGMIAQCLAIEHPELVKKLVLGVSASRANPTSRECISNWIGLASRNDLNGLILDSFRRVYSERYINRYEKLLPQLSKFSKPVDLVRFARLAAASLSFDIYDRLTEIRCPILVLGAMQDKVLTPQASLEIAEKTGCELYMYENLGHSAYEEAKDFNKRALEFFSK